MSKNNNILLYSFILLTLLSLAISCPQQCLFCLEDNTCITCQNQYYLTTSSNCVSKSVQNCRVYSEPGKCAICQPTYQVNNNQCVKDISGCLLRDKNGICQQCAFGTTLNIKGECLGVINCGLPQKQCKACRSGYKLVNNKCIYAGTDCDVIQSNGLCTQCKTGFILNGFECVSKGSNAVINGNINLIQKCSLYSRNENDCLQCEKGYTLFNNQCKSNGEVYNKTLNFANSKIRQNSSQIYIDNPSQFIKYQQVIYSISNRKDDVLDPNQKQVNRVIFQGVGTQPQDNDNCLIKAKDTLACMVCIDGYYYFNGLCKKKTQVCLKFNAKTNKCQLCSDSFSLINGQCLDPNCEDYLYSQCAKCKAGYSVNEQGYCFDPSCSSKIQGICNTCLPGYELDANKLCFKQIPGCSSYDLTKTSCAQCLTNYTLTNGACVRGEDERCLIYSTKNSQQCVRCRDQFALMQGTCIDLYCTVFQTARKCNRCKEGYILHPLFYCFDQNCVLYSNGTCIKCANNYILQNGFCVNVLIGCSLVDPSTQKCTNCVDSYRFVDGKCIYTDKERCLKYAGSLCISCKIEYALVNGTCVDLLCEKQTLFNNYYACSKCKPGYNITNQGLCYDQNCYKSSNGSCIWCADNYIIGPYGLCVKSTIGCLNWNDTLNKCLSCYTGYTLSTNGICTIPNSNTNPTTPSTNPSSNSTTNSSITPTNPSTNPTNPSTTPTTNPSVIDNTGTLTDKDIQVPVKPNDPNCKQYDKDNKCIKCEGKYFIRNGKCQLVSDNCKGFDMKSGNCTSCQSAYALYTEQSNYQDCWKKVDSDPNCTRKNTNFFCVKCKTGFYIKGGFCYLADTLCKTFDTYGGECLTCYEGYTLEESKCTALTKQSKCKTYDFQNVCIQCESRYFVDKAGVCKQINSACLTYQMAGGACLTCQLGYWPSNGLCLKVKDPTPNCKLTNDLGNCIECQNRFYLDGATLTCKGVNALCNDYNKNSGACLNCSSGYKLRVDLGLCVIDSSDDLCLTFSDTGSCTKCQSGYFMTTQLKCIKMSSTCSNYNQQTGDCQKCVQPYYLSFKECLMKFKKDFLDPNCSIGDTYNFCLKCKTGYYINTGNCLKASDQCKTFSVNTGACETCYDGFIIQNRQCVSSNSINTQEDDHCDLRSGTLCIKCKDRYYLSYDAAFPTCTKVNTLCMTYNEYNGNCYTCIDGYNFTNGNCVQNTNINTATNTTANATTNKTTYIEVAQIFCKEYDLPNKICKTCYSGYFYSLIESVCKPVNSDCRTYNITTGGCTSCYQGYYLDSSVCVYGTTSSIKQSQDKLTVNTNTNQLYCQTYNATTNRCITCYNGYQLMSSTGACSIMGSNIIVDPYCTSVTQSKCVNCLPGYFVELKTGLCTLVSLWCETYVMIGGSCTKCKVGSIMQSGTCIKPALGVDQYCSFYDGAYCISCVAGYKLANFTCQKA